MKFLGSVLFTILFLQYFFSSVSIPLNALMKLIFIIAILLFDHIIEYSIIHYGTNIISIMRIIQFLRNAYYLAMNIRVLYNNRQENNTELVSELISY